MNAQDIRNLSEAYMNVYDELDEAAKRSPKKVRGSKDTKSYQDGRSQAGMMVSGDSQVSGAGYMRRGGGIQTQTDPNERQPKQGRMDRYTRDEMEYRKARLKKEETDLYDIILSHLIDEGYAETPEAAEVIMVNMSEDWRENIMEVSDRKVKAVRNAREKQWNNQFGKNRVQDPTDDMVDKVDKLIDQRNKRTGSKVKKTTMGQLSDKYRKG